MSETRQRTEVVSMRLSADELQAVQVAADAAGQTVSAYVRNSALIGELRSRPGTRVIHSWNGGEILVWCNLPYLLAVS